MTSDMTSIPLDGATRLYGIVGDPIEQVRSPQVMTAWLQAAGHNAILVPLHVLPDTFETTLRGLMQLGNLDGMIFTVPYKPRALGLADTLLASGEQVGAINALRRTRDGTWQGGMFDGAGLVIALRARGFELRGRQVKMLGAGGAGSAIAIALAEAGVRRIDIHDVDAARTERLVARVRRYHPGCDARVAADPTDLQGHDLLINCTPVGLSPDDGLPAPFGQLDPALRVVDIIMKPLTTPLADHARACGCDVMNGVPMLDAQAQAMMTFLTGRAH